jgi:hypothetical protein
MKVSMIPLLLVDESVPLEARRALRNAALDPAARRIAARALMEGTNLDCAEVTALIGLRDEPCPQDPS